ncbi:FkbM family methyltransferase [Nitrosopumilus adriaticus]|uniref:FkbM family methyltransferase n=1 Tax=Nitrosopumilus adriaticus TaxID=1580092 RepID=UPI00352F9107
MGIKDVIRTSRKNVIFQRHPVKFVLAVFLMKVGLSKFLKISRKYYSLHFFPTPWCRTLWIEPNYWGEQDDFFNAYIKKNDIIIDVGANIGTITLTCATKTGEGGKVYSIEPNPVIFEYLERNIKLNHMKNVITFNNAIGNKSGRVDFSVIRSDGQSKIIENDFRNDPVVKQGKIIKVPVTSIDELNLQESEFSLMKIDVEGYEKFVILGASKTIEKINCIYFEVIEKNYKKYGYSPKEIFNLLKNKGFKLFIISEKNTIKPIDSDYNPYAANVLAIRKIDEFQNRTAYVIDDKKII